MINKGRGEQGDYILRKFTTLDIDFQYKLTSLTAENVKKENIEVWSNVFSLNVLYRSSSSHCLQVKMKDGENWRISSSVVFEPQPCFEQFLKEIFLRNLPKVL